MAFLFPVLFFSGFDYEVLEQCSLAASLRIMSLYPLHRTIVDASYTVYNVLHETLLIEAEVEYVGNAKSLQFVP